VSDVPGVTDAIDRLRSDPDFARDVVADPVAALAGYVLSPDDIGLLADALSAAGNGNSDGNGDGDERIRRASLFSLLDRVRRNP
jgi:hypothetical protein